MKSKIKKLEGTAREIHIEVPKDAVDATFDQVIKEIQKTAKMPGFRPGKVPMDIIHKNYTEQAMDEVKQRVIPKAYQDALGEHDIVPVSYPEITEVNMAPSGVMSFKAKVDSQPEVSLKKYKGLKVKTQKVKVEKDEVDKALEHLQSQYSEFVDVDRAVLKGDFGICDIETFMNGESISKKRENMWIEADEEASMLGMGKEIVGMKKGDVKDIDVTLPEGYPDKKYAGKEASFRVEVKEVKEKKLAELNDAFAEKLGKKTMDEVTEEIKSQLLVRKENNAKIDMKNQIMEQLLKKHSISLPETMVDRQLKVLEERAENELKSKGVDEKAIEEHKGKLQEQLRKEAENKVSLYFIFDSIANEEKIDVTDADVDAWLQQLAGAYNQPVEEVRKYYNEHNLIGGLKEQLREEKTLDYILEEADINVK